MSLTLAIAKAGRLKRKRIGKDRDRETAREKEGKRERERLGRESLLMVISRMVT